MSSSSREMLAGMATVIAQAAPDQIIIIIIITQPSPPSTFSRRGGTFKLADHSIISCLPATAT